MLLIRLDHREGDQVYWTMSAPDAVDLVNRCDLAETYEMRLAAGTLPEVRGGRT